MIFRLIASVFHLIAVIVRREAEIDNLKEKATKARKEIQEQTIDLQEANHRLMVLEIQRESDKDRIAALEKLFVDRREFDTEMREKQNLHITALTKHLESHVKRSDILDGKLSPLLSQTPPFNPTDN